MNKCELIGRATADIELKTTASGKNCVSFTLAVNRRGKDAGTDFIPCVAWDKTAEFLSKYIHKGERVGVVGRVTTRNYENKDGKKVYVTEVTVDEAEFIEMKNKETPVEFTPLDENEPLPF